MAKKRVVVGEDFDSLEAEATTETKPTSAKAVDGKSPKVIWAMTQTNIAYGTLVGGAVVVLGSAVLGIYNGSFDELQGVWNAAGPILGGIFGHYFGRPESE